MSLRVHGRPDVFRTARAASLVPSLEDVMPYHLFVLPMDVPRSTSLRVGGSPDVSKIDTGASLVPSPDDVMACRLTSVDLISVHVAPESADVHMFSSLTQTASLVPSGCDYIPFFVLPMDVTSVHVAPESVGYMFPVGGSSLGPSRRRDEQPRFCASSRCHLGPGGMC